MSDSEQLAAPHPTLSQPWGDPDYDPTCVDCREGKHGRLAAARVSGNPTALTDYQRGYVDGFNAPVNAAARVSGDPQGLREDVLRWAFTQYEGVWDKEPEVRILGHAGEAAKIIAGVYTKLDREYRAAAIPAGDPQTDPDCECGEPRSAGIHDSIRTWVNDLNKLHAFRAAAIPAGDPAGLDVERLARARSMLLDDIGTALSQELAQGAPFEPYDRIYVAKTITRVIDAARERVRVAAGPAIAAALAPRDPA